MGWLTEVGGVSARGAGNDPGLLPIPFARSAAELKKLCFKKASREWIGGMVTKLEAAERAGRYGIPTVIASGTDADPISAVLRGAALGVRFGASDLIINVRDKGYRLLPPRS